MRILIDGDACPVKNIAIKIAKKYNIEIFIFINENHFFESDYAEVIRVSQGKDIADFALVNFCKEEDIVVSNDYALISMAYAKKANLINFNGLIYNEFNLDILTNQKYINNKLMKKRKFLKGPSKRKNEYNMKFQENLELLIKKSYK